MSDSAEVEDFQPRRDLVHRDTDQLIFQIHEIFDEQNYLQYGVNVEPGDTVIDVGANVGVAAAFFASRCNAGAVHSFEPVPENHEILIRNVARFPTVHAYPFGLSARSGNETFTYYEGAAAMSGRYADPARDREMVSTVLSDWGLGQEEISRRLDSSFDPIRVECEVKPLSLVLEEQQIERIDLLKVDVERAELDVLAGIEERHWPAIRQVVAEVHDEGGRLDLVRSDLENRGFTVVTDQDHWLRSTGVFALFARR